MAGLALVAASTPACAANKARITGLNDVTFGTIGNLSMDATQSQSLCVYSSSGTSGYNVTASGSGPSGAFELSSGSQSMAFEVQWNSASGQTSGTQLNPNVPLTGLTSSATQQACGGGSPSTSASLTVILRSNVLSSVPAGTYNGILTLLVGPE